MTQPLAGLLVLDFTTLLPGPLAALMLAEAGAEVVKIERPPAGDEMRTYLPRWGDDSTNFALLNRGKSSVALALKDPVQKQRLMPCRLIDLDPALRDDSKDPAATTAAIAAILREKPGEYWRTLFAGQDCCCSVVAIVKEELEDPHFAARGLFRGTVSGGGTPLPALPVPVLPVFRETWRDKPSPTLGADTNRLAPEVGRPF